MARLCYPLSTICLCFLRFSFFAVSFGFFSFVCFPVSPFFSSYSSTFFRSDCKQKATKTILLLNTRTDVLISSISLTVVFFFSFLKDMSMVFILQNVTQTHCLQYWVDDSYQTNENDPNLYRIRLATFMIIAKTNKQRKKRTTTQLDKLTFILHSISLNPKLKEIQRILPNDF